MELHHLKIKENYFLALLSGDKTFEIRKNDRDFQVGDLIVFSVIDDRTCSIVDFGDVFRISYVLKDCKEYGLEDGYAVLSVEHIYKSLPPYIIIRKEDFMPNEKMSDKE